MIILRLAKRPFGYVAKHAGQTLYPTFGGANVAFRKACLAELGGYDPMTKLGEDTDICIRAFRSPWQMFSMRTARNLHRSNHGLWTFLKKWCLHGYYMAQMFRRYNQRAFEVFLREGARSDGGLDWVCVWYARRTPLRSIVFLSDFLIMNGCVAALLFAGLWPPWVCAALAVVGLIAAARYFRGDFAYSARLAHVPVNAAYRWLWNAAWLLGGLVGGVRHGMLLVNPPI